MCWSQLQRQKNSRSPSIGRGRRLSKRRGPRLAFEPFEARMLLAVQPLTLADPAYAGLSAFGDSSTPSMTDDGQLIAFQSLADNLVPNDTNGESDVFVYNRTTHAVTLVSVALDGTAAGRSNQYSAPVMSPNGRYIAFESSISYINNPPGNTSLPSLPATAPPYSVGTAVHMRELLAGRTMRIPAPADVDRVLTEMDAMLSDIAEDGVETLCGRAGL